MKIAACTAVALASFVLAPGVTLAGEPSSSKPSSSAGSASLSSAPLVTAASPNEAQQSLAEREAKLKNPEAVAVREESRTKYENLNSEQAAKLAGEVFPEAIGNPAGTLPPLPAGQQIVAYPTDNSAQVDLGAGKHGVIASREPLALETSPGSREPLDLSLAEAGGVFQPVRSAVVVRIPKQLADGVQLPSVGVSLTPVGEDGSALGGSEGAIDGATVLYANTQTDSDTVVKPLASGFEEDALLRSVDSPSQLSFRVGLPAGASLVAAKEGSGAVSVVDEGAVIAAVPAPTAHDAEGVAVPVSMSVSGQTVVLSVDQAGNYRYPIEVDPTVVDATLENGEGGNTSNWEAEHSLGLHMSMNKGVLEDTTTTAETGESGLWGYETHGKSHIYEFVSETSSSVTGTQLENLLDIVRPPGTIERSASLGSSYGTTRTELCSESGCATGKVESGPGNVAYFEQAVTKTREGGQSFTTAMSKASVYILQEQGPSTAFNASSAEISELPGEPKSQPNVLYTKGWLGPGRGAFEASGSDPGIGVSEYGWSSPGSSGWNKSTSGKCVQCSSGNDLKATYYQWCDGGCGYYEHPLPDGEDKVEFNVKDAVGLSSTVSAVVKVDGTPPYAITLSGLPPNKEIGDGVYHLKATAKDGSGSVPSSGVESLVLRVDGKQVGSASGSCTPGPCAATGEWAVTGTEFATGQHEVTVVATDRAGNVASEKFTMYVGRPTTPIALGPGRLDPQSGELTLNSTDVSVGAPGATLSVSRTYGSLHLSEGAEGPLGPQWLLSLSSTVNLTKLPDGDMLLTNSVGLQAVFASKGGGEFTAPKADAGLLLSEKTVEGKIQFVLKDDAGNVTTFTLSSGGGGNLWLPTRHEQANGLNATTVSYQTVGSITEPTQVLAPKPAGVSSCAPELVKGCRALGFVYATKTTATGDGQSEWGEYNGRLKEITFTAWEPSAGKMVTKAVAQYQYDKEGKLRAEWNPQISPALKTTYGYDPAGHVNRGHSARATAGAAHVWDGGRRRPNRTAPRDDPSERRHRLWERDRAGEHCGSGAVDGGTDRRREAQRQQWHLEQQPVELRLPVAGLQLDRGRMRTDKRRDESDVRTAAKRRKRYAEGGSVPDERRRIVTRGDRRHRESRETVWDGSVLHLAVRRQRRRERSTQVAGGRGCGLQRKRMGGGHQK